MAASRDGNENDSYFHRHTCFIRTLAERENGVIYTKRLLLTQLLQRFKVHLDKTVIFSY